MATTKDILERGYFPKELPPPFTTRDYASKYARLPATKPDEVSSCLRYSYSKYASLRRTLSIPNPAHMIGLADAISSNWRGITKHCTSSKLTRTSPTDDVGRAIKGTLSLDELPKARAEIRTGAQYVLQADVANFYGSIYTHAIPWAFHTKAAAKANRSSTLFGNVLDRASRRVQSGQTIGIPVGPDTSFAIAESILCAVDSSVQRRVPNVTGFRFADDYEFACGSLAEAEQIRAGLQDSLGEFELQLNPRKTRIIELPDVLDTPWVQDLASSSLDSTKKPVQESQLLRYFSRAFELVRQHPGEPVMKYALRRLAENDFAHSRKLLQQLVLQAATVDPGTLHQALYIIYQQRQRGGLAIVDQPSLKRALSLIIERHAQLQHGGDVAWALWATLVFKVELGPQVVTALERLIDPIAVLMALHAEQDGRLSRKLDRTKWEALVTQDELFDSNWLLVYEGLGQGWLGTGAADPALLHPFFNAARGQNVSFYDPGTRREIPKPSLPGEYA